MTDEDGRMTRRHAIGAGLAGAGLAMAGQALAAPPMFPMVETAQGKVRGLLSGGVAVFKGIRYGASTAGANRFMPPAPPPRWWRHRPQRGVHWRRAATNQCSSVCSIPLALRCPD